MVLTSTKKLQWKCAQIQQYIVHTASSRVLYRKLQIISKTLQYRRSCSLLQWLCVVHDRTAWIRDASQHVSPRFWIGPCTGWESSLFITSRFRFPGYMTWAQGDIRLTTPFFKKRNQTNEDSHTWRYFRFEFRCKLRLGNRRLLQNSSFTPMAVGTLPLFLPVNYALTLT